MNRDHARVSFSRTIVAMKVLAQSTATYRAGRLFTSATRPFILSLGVLLLLPSLANAVLVDLELPSPSVLPNAVGTVVTLPTSVDIIDASEENGSYANQNVAADEVFRISDGLPVGTEIKINGRLDEFLCVGPGTSGASCDFAGGVLGGEVQTRDGVFIMEMEGTGLLAGFARTIYLPINIIAENGPRVPGDAVQDFDNEMVQLQGAIMGDPDFDILIIRAGRNFGLPSPGHTTLTRQGAPGSEFEVESFFDLFYEIEFTGALGSDLDGLSGTTQDTVTIYNSVQGASVPEPSTYAMAALGLLGLGLFGRRRKRA